MNGSDAKEIDLVLPTEEGQQTMFEFGTLLSIIERLHRRSQGGAGAQAAGKAQCGAGVVTV